MSRLDKPLSEVLTEWEQSMKEDGITECRSHQWLVEHVNTGTVADFDAWIAQDHSEGPGICYQIIRDSHRHAKTPEDAWEVQRACAETLCAYPFHVARAAMQGLFMEQLDGSWDGIARKMLIDHTLKHHRKAKRFFSQEHVRPFVPEMDVDGLPDDQAD